MILPTEHFLNTVAEGAGRKLLITGAPGEIRTPDLLLRRQSLYPAELRARFFNYTVAIRFLAATVFSARCSLLGTRYLFFLVMRQLLARHRRLAIPPERDQFGDNRHRNFFRRDRPDFQPDRRVDALE